MARSGPVLRVQGTNPKLFLGNDWAEGPGPTLKLQGGVLRVQGTNPKLFLGNDWAACRAGLPGASSTACPEPGAGLPRRPASRFCRPASLNSQTDLRIVSVGVFVRPSVRLLWAGRRQVVTYMIFIWFSAQCGPWFLYGFI